MDDTPTCRHCNDTGRIESPYLIDPDDPAKSLYSIRECECRKDDDDE